MGPLVKPRLSRNFLLASTILFTVHHAHAQGAGTGETGTQLQTIVVNGQGGSTDTSDSLVAKSNRSATKTNAPVLETPQSVTTISRKQIDEQNPQTVAESLRYTAGVLSDRDSSSRYDSVFLRGFGAFGTDTNYVSYLDGLKLVRGQAFATPQTDPFFLDHIDVLKGPSALLYGQISPGGLVNQVSREPSSVAANEARLEVGTDGRVQSGLYSTGPLTEDETVEYGIGLVGRSAGSRYDNVEEQRIGVAPSLMWEPDADTSLIISGSYQRDPEGGYFNSIYPRFLAPANIAGYLDPDLNIGDPTYDHFERTQYNIGYQFEHRFDEGLTVRSALRYSAIDIDMQSLQMAGAPSSAGVIPRIAVHSIEDARGFSFDNHAEYKLDTGPLQHTLLAGVDLQSSSSSWEYLFGGASPLDVTNPTYGASVGSLASYTDSDQDLKQTGIYLQDQIEFGKLRAVLGIRHDWADQETDNHVFGTATDQSSDATTYRAGLLYLFDNDVAPYASYATSFEPVLGTDYSGNAFVPTEAEQYEIGVKYQPEGLDALFTVAAFDIRQQNVKTADNAHPNYYVQQGEIHSRGLEFEARGQVTSNIELIAALSLLDTEVSESTTTSIIGNRPQAVPRYFGSLWANYTFDAGALEGLTLGGGLRFVGSSYADDANTVEADGYTLVDAALKYDFGAKHPDLKGLQATLNVTNLLDEEYYSSCSYGMFCQYGNGRTVVAGLKYKW
jgi:iron complex outermembrane receptor protein